MFLWNFSSQLKASLDRLFGIFECYKDYAIPFKKCLLLMVAQESYDDNWTLFMDWYEKYIKNMGWENLGSLTTGGFLKPGDISGSPILDEARKLGESIK